MANKKDSLVEITRSFSFKLNLGNYQMADFFASEKCECLESEKELKSEALYQFCRDEVIKSVSKYLSEPKINVEELRKLGEEWQKEYDKNTKLEEIKTEEKVAEETK